jgi:hypothetical protein
MQLNHSKVSDLYLNNHSILDCRLTSGENIHIVSLKVEHTYGLILLVHNQSTRVQFPITERSEFCNVV